jgi:hypothetical protein
MIHTLVLTPEVLNFKRPQERARKSCGTLVAAPDMVTMDRAPWYVDGR